MTSASPARQDLLQIAADYADFCVLVTTSDLEPPGPRVLYVNAAWTRMTGYSRTDIIGNSPRILQGPETDTQMLGRLRTSLQSGKDFIARTANYKKNGEPFEIEWIISHLKDVQGMTTHYIALQRDITGMDRAQHELAHIDEELSGARVKLSDTTRQLETIEGSLAEKARFAALGEIAAGVVHDLSNALTPIFGILELLHSMDNLPEEARVLAGDLDVSIEHALNLLSNLRECHSAGGAGQQFGPVELRQLILRLPDLIKGKWTNANRASDAGIDFAFNLQDDAIVTGSDVELVQVLVNLALNSIDAMPDGGTITIGMALVDKDWVNVFVSDTGIGMSDELAKTCFEPYVKGRSTGTGLGLSVCRRIVEAHHGSIVAIPMADHGVTFRIALPVVSLENSSATDTTI